MMQVKRIEDNAAFTLISVKPWPDEPFAADVSVLQDRRNPETGERINQVCVRFAQFSLTAESAFEYAQAILRACDIARRLQEEGGIVLEGEEMPADLSRPPDLSYERLEELFDRMVEQRNTLLVVAEMTLHDYEAGRDLSDEGRALRIKALRNVIESCRPVSRKEETDAKANQGRT